ncbi:MAG: CPBP family intramembrane glutamic endopeptidase [Dehalococcoidia bacterium]
MKVDNDTTRIKAQSRLSNEQIIKLLTWSVYLAAIALAEWVVTYSSSQDGMIIYAGIFLMLVFHSYLESQRSERRLLIALTLAPLIQIINVALPLTGFYHLYRYVIISIPILLLTIIVIRILRFRPPEVGLTLHGLPVQIAVMITGIPLGIVGYLTLRPERLVVGLNWGDMILPAIIFILCVGFVQELIFRGVMQTTSTEVLGKWGILYISLLFAVLSMGNLSILNMVFMFVVALFFAWVVKRTGSILGVAAAHGIMSMAVYLAMPAIM